MKRIALVICLIALLVGVGIFASLAAAQPEPTPTPTPTPTPGSANCLRDLPSAAQLPGTTFDVTVTFTAPSDNFNSVGITDNVPTGWAIQSNIAWCTPNANSANIVGDQVQYVWFGPYNSGQTLTALYKITVPVGATAGIYTFTGQLGYHIGVGGLVNENIAGDQQVNVQVTPTPTPTPMPTPTPTPTPTPVVTPTPTPPCACVPLGFHAHYALRQQSTGQIRDTGIDASNPPPTSSGGWEVIQILVKH